MKIKKTYFLIVLFLCGLSVGNLFAAAPAAGRLGQELIDAAEAGNEPEVERLITRGADVNATSYNGGIALIMAAYQGHKNIVEKLLQVDGIDVNAASPHGWTALMWAAIRGHENIVKMLLDAGADKNLKNNYDKTAENRARAAGHEKLADMIRDYGSGRTVKRAVTGPDKNYM